MSSTTASTESANVPKAILYSWPTSVWSTVPQLCLHEKGYSEDEYIVKLVDIGKGENFSPSYLKINMNGTIPTLVVPTYETTAEDVDTRYRSLRDTVTICDFLDQARGMGTANQTVSEKPAPALAPATIEGKATSDQIITLVHRAPVDPNFVNVAARNEKELDSKRKGVPGQILRDRKSALDRFLAEAKKAAAAGGSHEAKAVNFLEEKLVANSSLLDIYEGNVDSARTNAFFETSQKTWTEQLSGVFAELEQLVKGPFCLGDQVSLADLHAISWLTRIVSIANANVDESAMDTVETELGGKKIGPKVRGFWNAWLSRESFQKVLVPAAKVFVKTIGA